MFMFGEKHTTSDLQSLGEAFFIGFTIIQSFHSEISFSVFIQIYVQSYHSNLL